jgi:predicted RecB family nuclease
VRPTLSKNDWLNADHCVALAWHARRSAPEAPDEGARFRMAQGQRVGALARELYPSGVLVTRTTTVDARVVTQELLTNPAVEVLFEATFEAGHYRAKPDILERIGSSWHVIEVKSSFSDSSELAKYVADLAYTTMVLSSAGLPVTKASLALLSRDYRFGMPAQTLFELLDKTADVQAAVAHYTSRAESRASTLLAESAPQGVLTSACRHCEYFAERGVGAGHTHTVLEIPTLHHTKFKQLAAAGVVDLSALPEELALTDRQQRVVTAALTETPFVARELGPTLDKMTWPCHYLDFETVATTLPLYDGHGCHQQVLTQFSVHHRAAPFAACTHREYLADARSPDERRLAENLITALGADGSVVVYSNFEKTRIKNLQAMFPDLAGSLQLILDRLVDLNAIVSSHVYHPGFRGSFSIKKVLPTLVPGHSYDHLAIRDGDTAIARFASMANGQFDASEMQQVRSQLLEYCSADTMAMVRLHDALMQMAKKH